MQNAGSSQVSWWKVNLIELYRINSFAVTARYDCCASSSLENAKLIVAIGGEVRLNPKWYELCGTIGSRVAARQRVEVSCPQNLPGDWAMIVRQGVPGQFGFCEVEVFGHRINQLTAFGRCYSRWTKYIICDGDNICEQETCRTKVLRPCHDKLQCRAGALCDSGKCKWERDHACTQNKDGNECRSGTFCDPITLCCIP
ncbi:uncharacterized protein LOC143294231 [Babylonia areolata]|uniref:uncharacterized protein LOC143294231 n=1 Tax=Babylonia areolata TaxID=304850 RepID=UPI003FD365DE